MKKITLLFAFIAISAFTFGQVKVDESGMFKQIFGYEKKEIVSNFVHPTDAQKAAFWKLWDEYEAKRKQNGKIRYELYKEYSSKYTSMTDKEVDDWFKKSLDVQKTYDNLIAEYYEKIKSATNSIVALQFSQIEYYIISKMRVKILEEIPFLPQEKK